MTKYTYSWFRQDFPPTIYDGVAYFEDFEVRIGGVTHGVVWGDSHAFFTHVGSFDTLVEAKDALIKNFEANEDKYLVHKTVRGSFVPSGGFMEFLDFMHKDKKI
jgi:hypothetical protein